MIIGDTIVVELHNAAAPYGLIDSNSGVIAQNGTGTFTFPSATINTSYFIVVKHRNRVAINFAVIIYFHFNRIFFAITDFYQALDICGPCKVLVFFMWNRLMFFGCTGTIFFADLFFKPHA